MCAFLQSALTFSCRLRAPLSKLAAQPIIHMTLQRKSFDVIGSSLKIWWLFLSLLCHIYHKLLNFKRKFFVLSFLREMDWCSLLMLSRNKILTFLPLCSIKPLSTGNNRQSVISFFYDRYQGSEKFKRPC